MEWIQTLSIIGSTLGGVYIFYQITNERISKLEDRFLSLDSRIEERFLAMDNRFLSMNQKFLALDEKWERLFEKLLIKEQK